MMKNIEDILESVDDLLDAAWVMPLTGGRVVVEADKIRELVDEIRANLPSEVRQAKAIVQDRNSIVTDAKNEAEAIIRKAEERRNQILSQEEIVVQAQEKALEIQNNTQKKVRDMRHSAQEFTDELLRRTEETLTQQMAQVRQARLTLRNGGRKEEDAE